MTLYGIGQAAILEVIDGLMSAASIAECIVLCEGLALVSCFDGSSSIHLQDGVTTPIDQLLVGDVLDDLSVVTSVQLEKGSFIFVEISHSLGSSLKVTVNHLVIVLDNFDHTKQWVKPAGYVKVGDLMLSDKDQIIQVMEVSFYNSNEKYIIETSTSLVSSN